MDEEFPKLLHGLIGIQSSAIQSMTEIAAQVNALRLTVYSIHPNAEAIHATLLPQVRDRLAEEIKRQQASLDLLKAAASKIRL
jgi:hypothetical protein